MTKEEKYRIQSYWIETGETFERVALKFAISKAQAYRVCTERDNKYYRKRAEKRRASLRPNAMPELTLRRLMAGK